MSRATAARRRLPRPERRVVLLDAALGAFVRDGYAVPMDAIAAAAGVTKPILYDHYADKRALYLAVIEREVEELRKRLVTAMPPERPPGGFRSLYELGYLAYLTYAEERPEGFRLLFRGAALADPEVRERVGRLREEIVEYMTAAFAERNAHLGVSADTFRPLAIALHSVIDGVGNWWLDVRKPSKEALARLLGSVAQRGLIELDAEVMAAADPSQDAAPRSHPGRIRVRGPYRDEP